MDKAPASGAGDSRFEPVVDHFFLPSFTSVNFKHLATFEAVAFKGNGSSEKEEPINGSRLKRQVAGFA